MNVETRLQAEAAARLPILAAVETIPTEVQDAAVWGARVPAANPLTVPDRPAG